MNIIKNIYNINSYLFERHQQYDILMGNSLMVYLEIKKAE
jgi:hypothetical protein